MCRKSTFLFLLLVSHFLFAQNYYDRASKDYNNQSYSEALQQINKAIESDENPSSFLLRAMIHQAMGNNSNAHDDYVKAISKDRDYYEAYFQFAEFLYETHEYERAIASLNFLLNRIERGETKGIFIKNDAHGIEPTEITTLVGMEAEILMKRGLAYQKAGLFNEAMEDFNLSIERKIGVDKLVNRALLYSQIGRESEAISDLTSAINLNPSSTLAWYNLLSLVPETEMPQKLEKSSEFAPMLSFKGIEAFESGDYYAAERLFAQALILTPNDPLLLLNSGRLDQRNQLFSSAQQKFIKVISLAPERTEALYLLGNAYFGQGGYRNAINYYQQYLKKDPMNAEVWFNVAMSYMELEESEKACSCLDRSNDLGMNRAATYLSEYCTKE